MPPRRKIDLLPKEFRQWLQDELKKRGFSGYDDLTEALNWRLEEEGMELRIGRTAVHAYGQEFQEYADMQERAQDEIRAFLEEASLKEEVDVTSALFQQLTTCAPDQLVDDAPVELTVRWQDPLTFAPRSKTATYTWSELIDGPTNHLSKGAALYTYAEALKTECGTSAPGGGASIAAALGRAALAEVDHPNDPDLAEIIEVLERF